jgi:hypothetical protein
MKVWLVPASDNAATANLSKTLSEPISAERKARGNVPDEAKFAWGAKSGPQNDGRVLNSMQPGDLCLFYTQTPGGQGKAYNFVATRTEATQSSQISEALWDTADFELVYYLAVC